MKKEKMIPVSYELLFSDKLSDVEKLVYIFLYSYKNGKSNISFPSIERMRDEMKIGSNSTINCAINKLIDMKMINKIVSKNINDNNKYELLFDMFKGIKGNESKDNYCFIPQKVFSNYSDKKVKMFYIKYHALFYTYKNNTEYDTFIEYLSSKLSLKLEKVLLYTYECSRYGLLKEFPELPGLTCENDQEEINDIELNEKEQLELNEQKQDKINNKQKIDNIDLDLDLDFDINYNQPHFNNVYDLREKMNNIKKLPKAVGIDFSDI